MFGWIKDRCFERTTLDGVVLIATGVVMIILPTTLAGYVAIIYGLYTIWKSE
jgi:hypothetical protein|tara:strand:+ start:269 stop:424 length:156 start_codon:yes stop_codon:yes gene_type:complete